MLKINMLIHVNSPLSLYIHIPWCIHKCPYCDFNSHARAFSEHDYTHALLVDLEQDLPKIEKRKINTIFIGGGTPSLFTPLAIENLLAELNKRLPIEKTAEITLEANPGTIDYERFKGFREAGVNRLSIGIQTFDNAILKILGRIHTQTEAILAIEWAKAADFTDINVDLMFGLPQQTPDKALIDLQTVIDYQPTHFSYYQLTIEPHTAFAHAPPQLPNEEIIEEIQQVGQDYLQQRGYKQYEISAYAQNQRYCQHNLNYWQFGDYLGIGAGAHSKITDEKTMVITRFSKLSQPEHYMRTAATLDRIAQTTVLNSEDISLEFMMNTLRLNAGFTVRQFTETTGLAFDFLTQPLKQAYQQGWLIRQGEQIYTTETGKRFLNEVLGLFLL